MYLHLILILFEFSALCFAWPAVLENIGAAKPYAPVATTCPTSPLIRPATSISTQEAAYISARNSKAKTSLAAWLQKQGGFNTTTLPSVAFASSGGSYRALLSTAGVIQSFDIRDSSWGTSGLYQGLTYESALSGGAWFLSSFAGNNWPTVSSLETNLWLTAFRRSILIPADLFTDPTVYADVVADIAAKQAAGYATSMVDPYGRLLSYQLLYGADGGVATRLSGLTTFSNFTSNNVPYPIIIADGVFGYDGQCYPQPNSTIYEFHPYEYGSWDAGVSAFAQTAYMGTNITNGQPTVPGTCTANYDNLGYILGTSSDIFNEACKPIPANLTTSAPLAGLLSGLLSRATGSPPTLGDLFALFPNPFYQYARATLVAQAPQLTLVDGGEAGQDVPMWPLIQPERSVDVIIANDNSNDTPDNFPNGTQLRGTYLRAQAVGLTKMPYVPDASVFVQQGLNKRATFFGCNQQLQTTLVVYLPNVNYTYASNTPNPKIEYTEPQTRGLIANGAAVGMQNGTADWPFCLACAVQIRQTGLPAGCTQCFEKYCYYAPA